MKDFMMIMARKISAVLMLSLIVFQLAVSPVVFANSVTHYGNWRLVQKTDEMDGTVVKFFITDSENSLSGWTNESEPISLMIPCELRDDGAGPKRRVFFMSNSRFEMTNTKRKHGQITRIKFDDEQPFNANFRISKTFHILGDDVVAVYREGSETNVVIIDALKKAQKFKLEVELFNTEKRQIAKFNVAGLSEALTHCDK